MLQKWFCDAQQVLDLFCQQLAVLIANLFRRSFEMNIDPAVLLEAIASLQTIVF